MDKILLAALVLFSVPCFAQINNGGGGSGSVTNQAANAIPVNTGGVSTALNSVVCTPPATPGQFNVGYTVPSTSAVAPTCPQAGATVRVISGSTATDTIGASTINDAIGVPIVHDVGATHLVAITLPTPTTLGNNNAVINYINNSAFTDTITPTTWTIQSGTAAAGASISVYPGEKVSIAVDQFNATNWIATPGPVGSWQAPPAIGGTTPAAGTFTTLIATGISDGQAPVIVTTGTTGTPGATYSHSYSFNEEATAATAVTYTLPTAAAGKQYCVANAYNGTAPNTGVLTIATSATGQFIIFTDGTLSATGGNVTSGGAAGDSACVVGVDATHWYLYVQAGTWTKH